MRGQAAPLLGRPCCDWDICLVISQQSESAWKPLGASLTACTKSRSHIEKRNQHVFFHHLTCHDKCNRAPANFFQETPTRIQGWESKSSKEGGKRRAWAVPWLLTFPKKFRSPIIHHGRVSVRMAPCGRGLSMPWPSVCLLCLTIWLIESNKVTDHTHSFTDSQARDSARPTHKNNAVRLRRMSTYVIRVCYRSQYLNTSSGYMIAISSELQYKHILCSFLLDTSFG